MKRDLLNSVCLSVVCIVVVAGCERQPAPSPMPPITRPAAPSQPPPEGNDAARSSETATAERPHTPPADPVTPPPASASKVPPADSKVATFAGLTGPKPVTWQWSPPQRQFSVAEYAVPGQDGHDQARIDVFKAGGSIEMNIDRWKTQFRNADGSRAEPKIMQFETDGMPVTLVEFAGEYKGMGMASFTPGQLFLCAIVQAPLEQIFIRLVGPQGTVEANRDEFMELIGNLKRVEPEK